ncbi:MAG: hypothetical protein QM784_39275 [Polyangiaceae bacterium]
MTSPNRPRFSMWLTLGLCTSIHLACGSSSNGDRADNSTTVPTSSTTTTPSPSTTASGTTPTTTPTSARPAYIVNGPIRTWFAANNATAEDVNPRYNKELNPNYPDPYPPYPYTWGYSSMMGAWSGAAFDPTTKTWRFCGEGHGDGSGNQVVDFSAGADSPSFKLTKPPTSVVTPVNNGLYPDGSPVARHTYNNMVAYDGELVLFGGASYPNGNAIKDVVRLDVSGTWHQDYLDPYPGGLWGDTAAWGLCAPQWEPDGTLRYVFWAPSQGTDLPCRKWDLKTRTWGDPIFSYTPGAYTAAQWLPDRKVLVILSGDTLYAWNEGIQKPTAVMVENAPSPQNSVLGQYGLTYDRKRSRLYLWNGGTNPGSIITLTPPATGQELTAPWKYGVLANTATPPLFAATDTGRPDNAAYGGTFGRLVYVEDWDAVLLVSRTSDPVSVLKLE